MRDAQAECKLSEKEFKSLLMISTTGEPHVLIRDWLAHDEDFFLTIHYNFITHYFKRIDPEEAKTKLLTYKAPRNSNLARVETHLMSLANRVSYMLPEGPS